MLPHETRNDVEARSRSEIARLQERVETLERQIADLRAERDRQYDENVNLIALQGAAEAERDRLREALIGMVVAGEAYLPVDDPNGPCCKRLAAARTALQKEPQTAQERDDGR